MKRRIFTEADLDELTDDQDYVNCQFDGLLLKHKDLSQSKFSECSFRHADWAEAEFLQTDLRVSNLNGLNICKHILKGAIISPAQFEVLARELGIQITA